MATVIKDQYRHLLPVVSIAAEVICYDLSDLPGLSIVCQFLTYLGRRKIVGQAKEVHWHFAVPPSEKPFIQKRQEMGKVPIDGEADKFVGDAVTWFLKKRPRAVAR